MFRARRRKQRRLRWLINLLNHKTTPILSLHSTDWKTKYWKRKMWITLKIRVTYVKGNALPLLEQERLLQNSSFKFVKLSRKLPNNSRIHRYQSINQKQPAASLTLGTSKFPQGFPDKWPSNALKWNR